MDTQIRTRGAAWLQAAEEERLDGKVMDLGRFEFRRECLHPHGGKPGPAQGILAAAVAKGILEPVILPRNRDFAQACEDAAWDAHRQEQENSRVIAARVPCK